MADQASFNGYVIVACGILRPEVEQLRHSGFLDADAVLYTAPGLHEWPRELEQQLARRLKAAAEVSDKIIVLYGEKCFIDTENPMRATDALIQEQCPGAVRVAATYCVDMLASQEQREQIAGARKVHWITPGWLQHWKFIFKDWDGGKANEMFPQYDKAVVLDAIGFFDALMEKSPETLLEISDWMNLPIEPHAVSLERFKRLLAAPVIATSK